MPYHYYLLSFYLSMFIYNLWLRLAVLRPVGRFTSLSGPACVRNGTVFTRGNNPGGQLSPFITTGPVILTINTKAASPPQSEAYAPKAQITVTRLKLTTRPKLSVAGQSASFSPNPQTNRYRLPASTAANALPDVLNLTHATLIDIAYRVSHQYGQPALLALGSFRLAGLRLGYYSLTLLFTLNLAGKEQS
jgi:hypothetical protein